MQKAVEEKLKSAWLIRWGFHGPDEDKSLERVGIKNKLIDIKNGRVTFEDILEHVKNLYRMYELSLEEKIYLEHYSLGKKRREELFKGSIPVFTSFQSDLYRNMMASFRGGESNVKEYDDLSKKWANYPQYILVGHNPYLEAKKVYNLRLIEEAEGEKRIEWEEPFIDGEKRIEKYILSGNG